MEYGSRVSGYITPVSEDAEAKPGTIYEVNIEPNGGNFTDAQINEIINEIKKIEENPATKILYYNVTPTYVVYQVKYLSSSPQVAFSPISVVAILLISAIVALILGWLGVQPFRKVYEITFGGFEAVIRALPGIAIMGAGGIVTNFLPEKTKIIGLVPVGIGAWMIYDAIKPMIAGSPPGEQPPSGLEDFYITDAYTDYPNLPPYTITAGDKIRPTAKIGSRLTYDRKVWVYMAMVGTDVDYIWTLLEDEEYVIHAGRENGIGFYEPIASPINMKQGNYVMVITLYDLPGGANTPGNKILLKWKCNVDNCKLYVSQYKGVEVSSMRVV
jgi:hypothetical protein